MLAHRKSSQAALFLVKLTGMTLYQDDAALEEMLLSNVPVDRLQKCHCAEPPQGIKGDIDDYVVHKALQELHLRM